MFNMLKDDKNPIETNQSRQVKIEPKPKPELVLNYRGLKSSVFFTLLWIAMAGFTMSLLIFTDIKSDTIEGFTLAVAVFYCLLSALQSYRRHGGPYISIYRDKMIVHFSMIHNQTINFHKVKSLHIENETAEFRSDTRKAYVPLGHLSFGDQKIFLDFLKETFQTIIEPDRDPISDDTQ